MGRAHDLNATIFWTRLCGEAEIPAQIDRNLLRGLLQRWRWSLQANHSAPARGECRDYRGESLGATANHPLAEFVHHRCVRHTSSSSISRG